MKTSQVDKPVTSTQPQIGNSRIYSGDPVKPYEGGAQHTSQPPNTFYKIYSSKQLPTVAVRLKDAGFGAETFTINERDFDSEIHEKK